MYKSLGLPLLFSLIGILFINSLDNISHKDKPLKKEAKFEPGWYAQFKEMKKNENGDIPINRVRRTIWQNELIAGKMLSTSNSLSNVNEVGPGNVGGRTRAIIVDIADSNHIIAGGVSGGIWNSFNKGISWTAVNDHAASLSVTSISQNPFTPNIIYYSTGEPIGNSAGIPGDGIFKSTDGGTSYTQLAATLPDDFNSIWTIKCSMVDSNTIYVGTNGKGLFRSIDAGQSFQLISDPNSTVTDMEVFPDSSVVLAIDGAGIYYSPNGNPGSFTKVTNGLPGSGFGRIEVEKCEGTPNVVYAQFDKGTGYYSSLQNIYRSNDGGLSWTTLTNPETTAAANYSFGWYCFLLGVSPSNPNVVVSGSTTLCYSINGGTSWIGADNSHADYHSVAFDKQNNNLFYIGNDGGIHLYELNTAYYSSSSLNTGYNVTQFYTGDHYPTGNDMLGGTQDNGTQRTFNSNPIFTRVFGGDGSYCAVNKQNANISYVSYQNGQIRKATNSLSGYPAYYSVLNELDQNWDNKVDDQVWFINPFEINNADGEQLYFSTRSRVWKTTNGANSWSLLTNPLGGPFSDVYCTGVANTTNPTVYIGGSNNLLYRVDNAATANPGTEFSLTGTAPAGLNNSFIADITVHPGNDSTIFIGYSNYSSEPRIYKVTGTNTGSPNWINISGDLPSELPVNSIAVHPFKPDSFIVAATDFGLYTTTNGGVNWHKETEIPNVSIHMIKLRESDGKLFIFTHGRGIYTAQLPEIYLGTNEYIAKATFEVFPNPVANTLNVRGNESIYSLELFGMDGRLVKSFSAFSQGRELNLADIPSGNYLLRINDQSTERIVKL